jgi:hypothetical protein
MTYDQAPDPIDNQSNFPEALDISSSDTLGVLHPNDLRRKGFTSPPPTDVALNSRTFINTPFSDLPLYFPTLWEPVAGADGGFNDAALKVNPSGVICILLPYLEQAENDFIWLELNGVQVAFHTVSADEADLGTQIVLFIESTRFIDQANNKVQAFVEQLSGTIDKSKLFTIYVDREHPVGPDPIVSTPNVNENMAAVKFADPQIEAFGVITKENAIAGVEILIEDYPLNPAVPTKHHRKEGDVIFVSIGGLLIKHTVTNFEASGNLPISVWAYFGTWEALPDSEYIVEWYVLDKVGNHSPGFSPRRLIEVQLGSGSEPILPAVFVTESDYDEEHDQDFIDIRDLDGDANIELPIRNNGYAVSDTVRLTIKGLSASSVPVEITIDHRVTSITPIRVNIPLPADFLLPLPGGHIFITYKRIRPGVADRPSRGSLYAIYGDPVGTRLPPPQVLDLDSDGSLPDHTNPVRILVPKFLGQHENDRVDLIVVGRSANNVPSYAEFTEMAGIGDVVFLLESAFFNALSGGYFTAHYLINGGVTRPASEQVTVPVGDARATLPPPRTLQALPPGFVFDPGTNLANLNVRIDPHPFIVEGVEIRVIATGTRPGGSITTDWFNVDINWEDAVIPFTIPRTIVLANLNSTMTLSYEVRPKTPGAISRFSQELVIYIGIKLELSEPPVVVQATAITPTLSRLNPLHVLPPVEVEFRVKYFPMLDSDDVKLRVVGKSGLGTPDIPSKPGIAEPGEDYIRFEHFSDFVAAYLGDSCEVYFEVTRSGNTTGSVPLTLEVEPLPAQALDLLSVPEATAGVIDIRNAATVRTAAWPFYAVGQSSWIYLEGVKAGNQPHLLTLRDASKALNQEEFDQRFVREPVPSAYLNQLLANSKLHVKGSVSVDGTNGEASALNLEDVSYTVRTTPALAMDTSPRFLNLNGYLLVNFFGGFNEIFYFGSARTATGGVPPYTYSSNNPGAISVNAGGRVHITAAGTATITVRDSAQPAQTASYNVTVNGSFRRCRFVGTGQWHSMVSAAAAWGGVLPNFSIAVELSGQYSGRWPSMGNIWTTEQAPGQPQPGLAYCFVNIYGNRGWPPNDMQWGSTTNSFDGLAIY